MEAHKFFFSFLLMFCMFQVRKCDAKQIWSRKIEPEKTFHLQGRADFTCPGDGFYAIPGECTGDYYACVGGNAILKSCEANYVFDPELKRCVPYEEATCSNGNGSTTTSTTSTTSTKSTTSTPSSTTSRSSTTTEATTVYTQSPFTCPSQNGFFPIPGYCGSDYYVCVGGAATLTTCPNGNIFDPQALMCLEPSQASCTPTWTCPTLEGFYAIPGSCGSDFIVCVSGSPYVSTCPNGNIFDPETLVCTPPSSASCTKPFTCPEPDGFFPIPDACSNSYYTCISNEPYITYCPNDGIFDPNSMVCVEKGNESC